MTPTRLAGIDVVDVLADPAVPGTGVPVIARWTLQELKDAIRAAIKELDAAEAARRARRARGERHVRVGENEDGTAELTANLPAEDAAAVFAALTLAAKAAKAAGDPRTLDQLRADELVHRATRGVHPDGCRRCWRACHCTLARPADQRPISDSGVESDVDSSVGSGVDSGV